MGGEILPSVFLRQKPDTLGKILAYAFPVRDVPYHFRECFLLPEHKSVFPETLFVEFSGKSQDCAGADGIHAEKINFVVPVNYCLQVIDEEIRSHEAQYFILGPFHLMPLDIDHAPATD